MHTFQNALKASKRYIHKNIRKNKRETNKGESHDKTLQKIKWPNSLKKIVPSGVTNCRNLPFGGRATRDSRVHVPRKEYAQSRHQRLFEENIGKIRKDVIYELKVKGSGVVFTHGEGISTPRVRHKRRQPLIKYANMTSIFIFPFTSLFLFVLFIFFIFFAKYVFIE